MFNLKQYKVLLNVYIRNLKLVLSYGHSNPDLPLSRWIPSGSSRSPSYTPDTDPGPWSGRTAGKHGTKFPLSTKHMHNTNLFFSSFAWGKHIVTVLQIFIMIKETLQWIIIVDINLVKTKLKWKNKQPYFLIITGK